MKLDRPGSVFSEDEPSSPESLANDHSPMPSPQPIMPDPYNEQIFSPYPQVDSNLPPDAYNFPPSPAYSTESYSPFDYSQSYTEYAVNHSIDYERQTEFMQAVQEGNPKEVLRIMSKYSQSVEVNGFTSDGQTALTQSCLEGNLEIVKILVSHGASAHLTNRDGFSPLHIACWCGKLDVMQFLLNNSANRR